MGTESQGTCIPGIEPVNISSTRKNHYISCTAAMVLKTQLLAKTQKNAHPQARLIVSAKFLYRIQKRQLPTWNPRSLL